MINTFTPQTKILIENQLIWQLVGQPLNLNFIIGQVIIIRKLKTTHIIIPMLKITNIKKYLRRHIKTNINFYLFLVLTQLFLISNLWPNFYIHILNNKKLIVLNSLTSNWFNYKSLISKRKSKLVKLYICNIYNFKVNHLHLEDILKLGEFLFLLCFNLKTKELSKNIILNNVTYSFVFNRQVITKRGCISS